MTSIPEFYAERSVFVTGGTGFMGKVLCEKLLRSCPMISRIYLLVRGKKGLDANTRIEQMFDSKVCKIKLYIKRIRFFSSHDRIPF